jgi:hypothetical protein
VETLYNRLLPLLLLLLAPPALAQAQFNYTTNNGAITITGYTGPGGEVIIPSTINDLPVTGIETNAFFYCLSLTSVTIPDSVTDLGASAFEQCFALTNVSMGSSITRIENGTFDQCTSLASIALPNRLTSVGDYAFGWCCSLKSVTIPSSVISIGEGAFFGCASLTGITIPRSVTNIQDYAFCDCTSLVAIAVDALNPAYQSVSGILFDNTQIRLIQYPAGSAVTNYMITNSVTTIAAGAFRSCSNLSSVTIPNSMASIGDGAFLYCTGLPDLMIPNSVTSIGDYVFSFCRGLISVTISDKLASIGMYAFAECSSLTSVTIPNSVTSIAQYAFSDCASLSNVVIGNSVTDIGYEAFAACSNLTSVTIPSSVTNLGGYAFAANGLTSVKIPASVTNIGSRAFGFNSSLTEITVDALNPAYSSVGGVLFDKAQTTLIECPGGKAVTTYSILNGVTNIGEAAFNDCVRLTNVTIPISVTSIADYAFYHCANLSGVYCQGNAPSIDSDVFDGDNATVYYLPGTTGWGTNFGGCPTALWFLLDPLILPGPSFGVQTNGFGFIISWATNIPVVVEACTDLANPLWCPVSTNILTGGSSYFSDPQWTNYPARFYRLRSP